VKAIVAVRCDTLLIISSAKEMPRLRRSVCERYDWARRSPRFDAVADS
jgi:hypothetical protein